MDDIIYTIWDPSTYKFLRRFYTLLYPMWPFKLLTNVIKKHFSDSFDDLEFLSFCFFNIIGLGFFMLKCAVVAAISAPQWTQITYKLCNPSKEIRKTFIFQIRYLKDEKFIDIGSEWWQTQSDQNIWQGP